MTLPTRLLIADHGNSGLREALRPLEALGLELVPSSTPETTRSLMERGEVELLVLERDQFELLDRDMMPRIADRPRPIPVLLVTEDAEAMSAIIAGRTLRGTPWGSPPVASSSGAPCGLAWGCPGFPTGIARWSR